jgi:8-oxo-dGTP pyrophosphatase MutT (NUDIX family)
MRFVLARNENDCYAFVERDWAENDTTWRQIIPYVTIRDGEGKFALFQRKNGSEKRLQDLFTIGVGGHIDAADIPEKHSGSKGKLTEFLNDILMDALARELWEEIKWIPAEMPELVHTIHSHYPPVDMVHEGLCFVAEWNWPHDKDYALPGLPAGEVPESSDDQLRYVMGPDAEMEMIFVGFKSLEEIGTYNLESWSAKLVKALLDKK